uniref:Uncharacterized protein n=1 Tax=Picea sitchensis TaxID=3332 RepID=A0A6B9XX20_PICSI|nr:hypothetical protein Q903MT_gene6646 [Picea sitchensis]
MEYIPTLPPPLPHMRRGLFLLLFTLISSRQCLLSSLLASRALLGFFCAFSFLSLGLWTIKESLAFCS